MTATQSTFLTLISGYCHTAITPGPNQVWAGQIHSSQGLHATQFAGPGLHTIQAACPGGHVGTLGPLPHEQCKSPATAVPAALLLPPHGQEPLPHSREFPLARIQQAAYSLPCCPAPESPTSVGGMLTSHGPSTGQLCAVMFL